MVLVHLTYGFLFVLSRRSPLLLTREYSQICTSTKVKVRDSERHASSGFGHFPAPTHSPLRTAKQGALNSLPFSRKTQLPWHLLHLPSQSRFQRPIYRRRKPSYAASVSQMLYITQVSPKALLPIPPRPTVIPCLATLYIVLPSVIITIWIPYRCSILRPCTEHTAIGH